MSIGVVVIEDHQEFRESISYILHSTEGFRCVGAFGSMEDALTKMTEPDVVLLDINLPGMSGIEGIERIKRKYPDARIVMLTVFEDNANVFHAILSGADGYILKKTPPIRLLQAIEDAAGGGSPMTPTIARQALDLFKTYAPQKNQPDLLTAREREVLALIVDGLGNDEISMKLFISLQTVRNHIRHIYEKLHVHSKSQAVVRAIKQGLI
jgi:DNA-binding NarL/FixJ family response regulator